MAHRPATRPRLQRRFSRSSASTPRRFTCCSARTLSPMPTAPPSPAPRKPKPGPTSPPPPTSTEPPTEVPQRSSKRRSIRTSCAHPASRNSPSRTPGTGWRRAATSGDWRVVDWATGESSTGRLASRRLGDWRVGEWASGEWRVDMVGWRRSRLLILVAGRLSSDHTLDADHDTVALPCRELAHLPDGRASCLCAQVQHSSLVYADSYVGAVSVVGGVEQQQVKRLRNRYADCRLCISPQLTRTQSGRSQVKVPKNLVGEQLAVRTQRKVRTIGHCAGPRKTGADVRHGPEGGR